MKARKIIKDLQSDPRLMAECPECGGHFSLKKAFVFHIEDPLSPSVQKWMKEYHGEIEEREINLKKRKKRLKEIPYRTSAVNRGKIIEKLAPAFKGVKFELQDYRALFEPIDYICFDGLTKKGIIQSVKFIDCKTGGAGLNEHQKQIKKAVEEDDISFETY